METYRTNFYQLAVFADAIERASFTRAAESFRVTQPVVSRIVKNLEKEYGATLTRRDGLNILPTAAGEIFYSLAHDTVSGHHHARGSIHQLEAATAGSLRLGVASSAYERIVPHIAQLLRVHTQADIQVRVDSSSTVSNDVRNGDLDAGVVLGYAASRYGVTSTRVWKEEMAAVVSSSHPIAKAEAAGVADPDAWAHLTVIATSGASHRSMLEEQVVPRLPAGNTYTVIQCGSPEFVKRLVEDGVGLTALPRVSLEKDVAAGRLAILESLKLPPQDLRLIENPRVEASMLLRQLRQMIGSKRTTKNSEADWE